jgi:hypothetical protein
MWIRPSLRDSEVAAFAVEAFPEKRIFIVFEADYEAITFQRFEDIPWIVYVVCTRRGLHRLHSWMRQYRFEEYKEPEILLVRPGDSSFYIDVKGHGTLIVCCPPPVESGGY